MKLEEFEEEDRKQLLIVIDNLFAILDRQRKQAIQMGYPYDEIKEKISIIEKIRPYLNGDED